MPRFRAGAAGPNPPRAPDTSKVGSEMAETKGTGTLRSDAHASPPRFPPRRRRIGRGQPLLTMAGSPSIASLFAQRVVIGVGDMAVSNNHQVVLSTYALGSCIGVLAYDATTKAAGILHLMLPDSTISPEKAGRQPAMFADTGLPLFCRALAGLKADRGRLRLFVAGGASVIAGSDPFKIGERNAQVTMQFLIRQGLRVVRQDTGGAYNRTVHLEVNTGEVTLKTPTATTTIALAV